MNVYEIVTERIVAELERGTVPWRKPWRDDGSIPANLVSKRAYRGMNLLLLPRTYPTNWFLSYRQCEEMGYTVKKGEKGNLVILWKFFTPANTPPDGEPDEAAHDHKIPPMLRYYHVFNVAQTTIPDERVPHIEKRDIQPIAVCESTVENMPNRPTLHLDGESQAVYYPGTDTINMPSRGLFRDSEHYYSTLFHELGHSTGHESRLNRSGIASDRHGFGSKSYSREELVAEIAAAFLCGHCGIDTATIENTAAYIAGWKTVLRNDPRCVVIAASQAQKAADYILARN